MLDVSSPELVYVSGRARPAGEINGKSGNLNNALNLIYPPGVPIPLDEARPFEATCMLLLSVLSDTCPLPLCWHSLLQACVGARISTQSTLHSWRRWWRCLTQTRWPRRTFLCARSRRGNIVIAQLLRSLLLVCCALQQ